MVCSNEQENYNDNNIGKIVATIIKLIKLINLALI